jgi:hypothetical protein
VVGDQAGTPQGAVASPLIANVYLHYIFDLWADVWRRKNQRPSPSWTSPTTVGNATRAEPSPYGGSLRRSEWLRSSKPSRLSFNAGGIIAWPKSVRGSGRLYWVIINTTLFPGTRLSCASSNFALQAMAECSGPSQPARTDALGTSHPSPEPVDSSTARSAPLSRCTLLRHSSFVRAVCVDALVRICAGAISDDRPYRDRYAEVEQTG